MEVTDPGDIAAILVSYEPHETTFQKPKGKGELGRVKGAQPVRVGPDLDHLEESGQPSQSTPNKLTHKEFEDAGVIGMVSRVSWGTYDGKTHALSSFPSRSSLENRHCASGTQMSRSLLRAIRLPP
jgi:hypothetical protein